MFDVLVYLYENYWRPEACPEPALLERKLAAVGFEDDDIEEALNWLSGLSEVVRTKQVGDSKGFRLYSPGELEKLGQESVGFLTFLTQAGVLPAFMREVVIDRVMAVSDGEVNLESLKIIVLMVFWTLGEEPDALILDELLVEPLDRVIH